MAPHDGRPGARLMLLIESEDPAWEITLYLHATERPESALRACRFIGRDAAEAERQRIHAAVEQAEGGLWAKFEDAQQEDRRSRQLVTARERLFAAGELVPRVRRMRSSSGDIAIRLGRAVWLDGQFWTSFVIENQAWRPLRLANAQIRNRDGTILSLRDVALDPPARMHGEAGIAEVPPGYTVAGVMRLPDIAQGVEPQALTFTGFTGPHMFVATAEEPVWVWVPRREDQVREELRQEAALRAARGVVTLSLQGTYGAMWLGDGTGLDQSDATSVKGLGVRMMYGITPMIAFEGELMGAGSGDAYFADVTWNDMQGDLTRRAALGRIQFGGVLRFGKRYIPMVRMGVGLQGANHSGTLATATGDEPGPGAFEWTSLFSYGAGIDVRLGAIRAGIALSGLTPFGALGDGLLRGSIEAGIHLGYAWKP